MVQILDLAVLLLSLGLTVAMSIMVVARMIRRGRLEHTGYGEAQAFRDIVKWFRHAVNRK